MSQATLRNQPITNLFPIAGREGSFNLIINYPEGHESRETVYETSELAAEAAARQKSWWGSNLVLLGNKEIDVDGKIYFTPQFNVFD